MRHESPPRSIAESGTSVEVPEETARDMKACVEAMKEPSAEPSYAFQYNLGASEQGKVLEVKLHDSTLREPSLEACFEGALRAMAVPKDALGLRGTKPFSGGESTYSSRADVGIVQAAAAPIAMLPIILVAAGVTIVVGVTIYVATEAITEKERCKKVKADCLAYCSIDTLHQGRSEPAFTRCMRACLEKENCW